jgi:plasmid replication initiation protein
MLEGKKLNQKYSISEKKSELYEITMPTDAFLCGEDDEHYTRVKEALESLSKKTFRYEDERVWRLLPMILIPKIAKNEGFVSFRMHEDIYDVLLDFTKGFRKYELQTTFLFDSVYAMRFYELFSGQRTPLIFSIENLKIMFGVEEQYKLTIDFIRYVIVSAKKVLDEKSPYSFEFCLLKTGKRITGVKFYPVYIPQNADEEFETYRLKKMMSPSWSIEPQYLQYLKEHYMFSTPEIRNNVDLFERAQKEIPDLLMFMSQVKARANRARNPKGYLINALRKEMNITTPMRKPKP